jgi:hypothetical protein
MSEAGGVATRGRVLQALRVGAVGVYVREWGGDVNPSHTLREIAAIASNPVVKERLEQLAAEFEVQHNQQNNNFGIALGMAQNTWEQGLDDIRQDMASKIGKLEQELRDLFAQSDQRDAEILRRLDLLIQGLDHDT